MQQRCRIRHRRVACFACFVRVVVHHPRSSVCVVLVQYVLAEASLFVLTLQRLHRPLMLLLAHVERSDASCDLLTLSSPRIDGASICVANGGVGDEAICCHDSHRVCCRVSGCGTAAMPICHELLVATVAVGCHYAGSVSCRHRALGR